MVFYCILGVLIIPKWPTKASRHIPTLVGSFWGLPKCSPNLAPYTPYLSQKYFKKYTKNPQTSLKHIFYIPGPPKCCQLWKRRAPKTPEELSNQISKIMDMRPISIKK